MDTEQERPADAGPVVERGVVRPGSERASDCKLTECAGKPMCQRCAVQSGAVLKPCPWCWTDGADLFDLWDRFDAGHIAHVHCTHCGADGPSCYSETSADDAIKQARHRWNSRTLAPPTVVRSKTHNVFYPTSGDSA
jgi:hypothetical protein